MNEQKPAYSRRNGSANDGLVSHQPSVERKASPRGYSRLIRVTIAVGIVGACLVAFGPNQDLIDGGSPEGVAKSPEHVMTIVGQHIQLTEVTVENVFPVALLLSKDHFPDAALVSISARGVRSDGTINLVQNPRGILRFDFRSPSRSDEAGACMHQIELSADGMGRSYNRSRKGCTDPIGAQPNCSLHQVWQAAIAVGADPLLLAELGYSVSESGSARWVLTTGSGLVVPIPDDCAWVDQPLE